MDEKIIYEFGKKTDGNASMRSLLGGKGANLAEMAQLGLPVPPGFTITTAMCTDYQVRKAIHPELKTAIKTAIAHVEEQIGKKFGGYKKAEKKSKSECKKEKRKKKKTKKKNKNKYRKRSK